MTEQILRKHHLRHIAELRVSEEVFETRFRAGCSMFNCKGVCCEGGADIDLAERDRILQHAERVRANMDAAQEHSVDLWFEDLIEDKDFPSGRAVTTRMHNDRCVFLNGAGLCVLQITEEQLENGEPLKPFFCRAFPICLNDGVLTIDHQFDEEKGCCGAVQAGALTVFDVCALELEHVLGKEGAAELRALAGVNERA